MNLITKNNNRKWTITEQKFWNYSKKKASGELSFNLKHPTPASLRSECHLLFTGNRYTKADLYTLKSFFQCPENEELRPTKIKRFDADKFKPLNNFLKLAINTSEKNVEILAWLIDFKHRPYSRYIDVVSRDASGLGLSRMKVLRTGTIIENLFPERDQQDVNRISEAETKATRSTSSKPRNEYVETAIEEEVSPKITLEYPSGVKIKVDVDNLALISLLVKL
ncbi:hypothetical protein [Niabella hibiscisoli]|uniref:hypothetical protein n=1 Tax=Niabella hibiscisoli TaxID=1825928 RepID=UPI001F109D89|nr:hypothetical protein [Niabella hibiscisoli]MCH5716687.1 hypothetical protein [Niabella hibiscisoli]